MEEKWRHAMATLNIKNLPDPLYRKLRAWAQRRHRSLSQEVIHILTEVTQEPEPLSILDLRGLGKEYWEGIDPSTHVEQERRAWD
jgi:hypothetical protein